jgi:hypothetical protein
MHEQASFILRYGELEVGYLRLRDGVWEFEYAPEFKAQVGEPDGVQPLLEFPDPGKLYSSADLWSFFLTRIPSIAQPQVREEIERRGLDASNAAQLLRAFGERSISNPFSLLPAA